MTHRDQHGTIEYPHKVGDNVRYHDATPEPGYCGRWFIPIGWRFGRIIGRHEANGLEMATVRFSAYGKLPEEDVALPCFRLDRIS